MKKKREPKGVKLKARECKLRSGVNWQGELKQKGVKQRRYSGKEKIFK